MSIAEITELLSSVALVPGFGFLAAAVYIFITGGLIKEIRTKTQVRLPAVPKTGHKKKEKEKQAKEEKKTEERDPDIVFEPEPEEGKEETDYLEKETDVLSRSRTVEDDAFTDTTLWAPPSEGTFRITEEILFTDGGSREGSK